MVDFICRLDSDVSVQLQDKCVLVVDDCKVQCEMMANSLRRVRCGEVINVGESDKAIALIRARNATPIDVVVVVEYKVGDAIDLQQLCGTIAAMDYRMRPRVVLLSASSVGDLRLRGLPVDATVSMPLHVLELLTRVGSVSSQKRSVLSLSMLGSTAGDEDVDLSSGGDMASSSPLSSTELSATSETADGANGSAKTAQSSVSELSGLRVLVVDDNEVNRTVTAAMLEHRGASTFVASDGAEALQRVDDLIDLVLMDLHMPILDGRAAAQRMLRDRVSPVSLYFCL